MDDLKARGEISRGGDGRAFGDLGFECRMVGVVGEKRRLFGGGVVEVVEGEFSKREIVNPIILLI